MRTQTLLALWVVSTLLPVASGQSVISARSGLVNFFEGVVFLDGQPLARKSGTFARMRDGSTLMTEAGRAEVLLTPDTYFRIGESTSIRMISDSISDTQVELLAGSSVLDSSKAPAGAFVKIVFKDATIRILKPGHYRIDAEPPQLRVYVGEAEVSRNGDPVKIESSQLLPLDGASVVKRFTQGSDGLLDLWSEERGSLIASNMVNSQTISDPLLDSGPGVPADLASYIGYMPLATVAPYGINSYGYSYLPGLSPYPGMMVSVFAPFPAAAFLYAPRRYTTVFSSRTTIGSRLGIGSGIGILSSPRTITMPRPIYGTRPGTPVAMPRVGGVTGVRPSGRR